MDNFNLILWETMCALLTAMLRTLFLVTIKNLLFQRMFSPL